MMGKKSSKYQTVSSEEFKKGAIYSLYNAFELYGDAMILNAFDRKPRVYSLIKLSFEEAAKSLIFLEISILRNIGIEDERLNNKITELLEAIEYHNYKTKYAIKFLISKRNEFIKFHPNSDVQNEESFLIQELREYELLLKQIEALDNKKNTNLYTSLIGNVFKPPFLSVEEKDVEKIKHLTFKLLVFVKNMVLKIDNSFFDSTELKKEMIQKLDANVEARNMHKLKVTYLNHIEEIKRKYPHLKFE